MLKKIIKLLTNNLGFKILSVLVAIMVWLVVVNLDNPDKTMSFTIPVNVINEANLADMGKVYEVYNNTDVATIYVNGKRALMDTLSASDFRATADLGQIDFQSQGNIKFIPITVEAVRYSKDLTINQKTNNMQITIEDLSTKQFSISGEAQGTPAESYAIGEVTVSPNLIQVSGPQSQVSRIKRVVAVINVDNVSSNVTDNVVPILYDENDKVIESSQLKLSQDRVTVGVQMLGTKEVPIRCLTHGEPADGYQFIGLEYAPQQIWIKGVPAVLNGISEIVIPGEAIDLEGATGNVENSIDITPYLEALGVMLRNSEENKVAVKATVERLDSRNFELPVSAIEVMNLDEAYELTFGASTVTVQVRGRSEELQSLTAAEISGTLDLQDVEPGDYNMELQLKVSEPYKVLETVLVQIHVFEKGSEPDGGLPGQDDQTIPTGPTGPTGGGGTSGGSTGGGSGNIGGGGTSGGSTGGGSGNTGSNNNENNDNEVTGNE